MITQVYISVGSNIDRDENIRAGLDAMYDQFGELVCSPVYESVAFGFEGDNFYNLVVGFRTEKSVKDVANTLREIENVQQRARDGVKFSSRTLDLDLILYGDLVLHEGRLRIPREDIKEYAFVLQPLADIAPQQVHPELKQTYEAMWAAFDKSKSEQYVVDAGFLENFKNYSKI